MRRALVVVILLLLFVQPVAAFYPSKPPLKPTVEPTPAPTKPPPEPTAKPLAKPTAAPTKPQVPTPLSPTPTPKPELPTPTLKPTALPPTPTSKGLGPPTPTPKEAGPSTPVSKPTAESTPGDEGSEGGIALPTSSPDAPSMNTSSSVDTEEVEKRSVTGRVFDDQNGNGVQDRGEQGVAGVPIVLDDQVVGATDEQGFFSLSLPGAELAIVAPMGWEWSGESVDVARPGEISIPLRRQASSVAVPGPSAAAVTGGAMTAAALLVVAGLAFSGAASLLQASAVRGLERTYRRQKSQELELAMTRDLAQHREQLRTWLADDQGAWRELVERLLADVGMSHGSSDGASMVTGSSTAPPSFVVAGEEASYTFSTAPRQTPWLQRWRERALFRRTMPLDATVSLYARVETQALWEHLVAREESGLVQHRSLAWYLSVERRRKKRG